MHAPADPPSVPVSSAPAQDASIPPDTFRSILIVMERLAASSDLNEVLRLIIDSMRDCLVAERASVFQYDAPRPDGGGHELFASSAHGVDRSLRFSADRGLAGEAVRTRQIINVPDCYADPRFNPDIDRQTGFHTRNMLTIPLVSFDGGLEGVAQVLNKQALGTGHQASGQSAPDSQSTNAQCPVPSAFSPTDETLARALASQAAVAIRRARLIEAERRKDKIEADLRIARDMQRATFPSTIPAVPGYDIAASNRQAEETGGDTYDLVPLGSTGFQPVSEPGLLILMADATGHGIGPALSATQVQSMLRMAAGLAAPLEQTIIQLNALMARALPPGRFVTAFIGILEPESHRVRYVSAGQAPIVVLRAGGGVEESGADVPPLGVDAVIDSPPVQTIALNPGDTLLLLSDGYYEHTDGASHQQAGLDRVIQAIRATTTSPAAATAAAMLAALTAAMDAFGRGRPPADDQTAIIIRRTG